jgi:hypothetical protein
MIFYNDKKANPNWNPQIKTRINGRAEIFEYLRREPRERELIN